MYWPQDMQLASAAPGGVAASATQAEPPPTLLIINPGDTAFEMTPPGKHEVGQEPGASASGSGSEVPVQQTQLNAWK